MYPVIVTTRLIDMQLRSSKIQPHYYSDTNIRILFCVALYRGPPFYDPLDSLTGIISQSEVMLHY
jgi:hypothetical protein